MQTRRGGSGLTIRRPLRLHDSVTPSIHRASRAPLIRRHAARPRLDHAQSTEPDLDAPSSTATRLFGEMSEELAIRMAASLGASYHPDGRRLRHPVLVHVRDPSDSNRARSDEFDHFILTRQSPEENTRVDPRAYENPTPEELEHRLMRRNSIRPSAEQVEEVHPEWICPITREVFRDPVVASDGHSYERLDIERWIAQNANPSSPMTNQNLAYTNLYENIGLRKTIEQYCMK